MIKYLKSNPQREKTRVRIKLQLVKKQSLARRGGCLVFHGLASVHILSVFRHDCRVVSFLSSSIMIDQVTWPNESLSIFKISIFPKVINKWNSQWKALKPYKSMPSFFLLFILKNFRLTIAKIVQKFHYTLFFQRLQILTSNITNSTVINTKRLMLI